MKVAVRYKSLNSYIKPVTVIIDVPDDIPVVEDTYMDYTHDIISEEILGSDPKWMRIEGKVEIEDLF